MYSSIEKAERKQVINRCYWPLFKLADMDIPIGIEAPAVTLEIINKLDPSWIAKLSEYISSHKIEFIASGYSQIIGPLVPAKVNEWNQRLGLEKYEQLFGVKPKLALVNEMAYSSGILEHYINMGYKGVIMEWNNPKSFHPEWKNEWRYNSQKVSNIEGKTIPIIWADSIIFQKFQRYAHGEYDLNQYVNYLKKHLSQSSRFLPLYSNDVEIFDYRPSRYQTEAQLDSNDEWNMIFELYSHLKKQDWCDFIFPSRLINITNDNFTREKLKLETSAQPIPVKKQEKYNINRWALSGRDDMNINSKCYKLFNLYIINNIEDSSFWKELCYLWSSDFRTHITKKRWETYYDRLENQLNKFPIKNKKIKKPISNNLTISEKGKLITIGNKSYEVVLNKHKGLSIDSLSINNHGVGPLLGTLEHGYYDDISLGADFFSSHATIENPGEHKVSDLNSVQPNVDKDANCISANQKIGEYEIKQTFYFLDDVIKVDKCISTDVFKKGIVHPYNFTFFPQNWNQKTLYFSINNGGSIPEKFYLDGENFSHNNIYSTLISARHGLGNTDGIITIGDKDKSIAFKIDMSISALIPSIIYKEIDQTFFFRLQFSAREMDETLEDVSCFISSELSIIVG